MYITAYIFLMAIIVLTAIKLWQAIAAQNTHAKAHCVITHKDLQSCTLDIATNVKITYINYKGSSGVLEAYRAGLAFRVAEAMYDASQAILVSLKRDQAELPAVVSQCVLEELRWEKPSD